MDDNLYPNDGEHYSPFPNRAKKKRMTTISGRKVLKDSLKHLDDRIAATDSVKQAMILATEYEISREAALVVLDVVRTQLETERSLLSGVLDTK